MVSKYFRDQYREQKFSWNLNNFKFEVGFEPEPINYKSVTLATRPWVKPLTTPMKWYILKRKVSKVDCCKQKIWDTNPVPLD